MDLLERLQKKPEHERKQIAVAATLVIFAGILLVWAILVRADKSEAVAVERVTPSPFEALGSMLKASVSASSRSFERAPAPTMNEAPADPSFAVTVEQAPATTTTEEVLSTEDHSDEILPPPAP